MSTPLLDVVDLSVSFGGDDARIPVLNRVNFSISRGETVVLVGESGSGKSMAAMSIVGCFRMRRESIQVLFC